MPKIHDRFPRQFHGRIFNFFPLFFQFRHQIKRSLQKTPCCQHRIKTANRQRDDDVIDKTHHQMYASTATIANHNPGIQLTLEQSLAPSSSGQSGSSGSGSTSSTGTASSADQQLGKVGDAAILNNHAFYLNNLRPNYPSHPNNQQPPPPPYVNQINRFNHTQNNLNQHPASLPASIRATPTADFELYPRHFRTNSYTQATQHLNPNNPTSVHRDPTSAHRDPTSVQSTPLHRRYGASGVPMPNNQQNQFQRRNLRPSGSCNSILSSAVETSDGSKQQSQLSQQHQNQLLYDKLHGRQSSSSAG